MYNIPRIENRVTVTPLVREGSPFTRSNTPEKIISKRGDYKGVYFFSESFEMKASFAFELIDY